MSKAPSYSDQIVFAPQARWARRIAGFALLLLLVSAIGHRYGQVETPAFLALLAIIGLLAVLALLLALLGFVRIWREGDAGAGSAGFAFALATALLAPFAYAGLAAATHPALSDVTTDAQDPPSLDAAAALRDGWMAPVQPITADQRLAMEAAYPLLGGRAYDLTPGELEDTMREVAASWGWPLLARRAGAGETVLEFTAYSMLFAFPSDVAVRLVPAVDVTLLDIRSASRYGSHDLGENAARTQRFLNDLDEAVAERISLLPLADEPEGEEPDSQSGPLADPQAVP